MPRARLRAHSTATSSLIPPPPRIRSRRLTKRVFVAPLFLGFLLSTNLLSNWTLLIKPALAASLNPLPGASVS